jgi:hypothetical protein
MGNMGGMGGMGRMGGMGQMGQMGYGGAGGQDGKVLLVNGIHATLADPDTLFTIFGCFGNVQKVKILNSTTDKALVQFQDPLQANRAKMLFHGITFEGTEMKIITSKYRHITGGDVGGGARGGATESSSSGAGSSEGGGGGGGGGDLSTKDFTAYKFHRFPRAEAHVYAPSLVLHVGNIPECRRVEEHL